MIRSLYRTKDGRFQTDLKPEQFGKLLQGEARSLLWVDFEDNPPEVDEPILRDTFGFHPLAIEDALRQSHVPKLDDWGEYLYVVLHTVQLDRQSDGGLDTLEVDVFLGKSYIVTHHDKPIEAIERAWTACQRDERHLKSGPDHLLYRIADEIAASYMPVVEKMDEVIDQIEGHIFNRPSPDTVERIFSLKRGVLQLRRILGPQREVLNKLARDDYTMIDPKDRIYFRDVYDHLVRLHDITESVRDLVSGSLDTYLSVVNNRMNDIMKTLTIVTTLFMPLSFITGYFGMNFFQPTEPALDPWTGLPMFLIALAITILTPIGMMVFIRRRGWL